jgi:hypothetical protein
MGLCRLREAGPEQQQNCSALEIKVSQQLKDAAIEDRESAEGILPHALGGGQYRPASFTSLARRDARTRLSRRLHEPAQAEVVARTS